MTAPGGPLTPEERARLRRTVDPAALERFLAAAPEVPRRAAIAHFAERVTFEDIAAVRRELVEAGALSEEEEAAERQLEEAQLRALEAAPPPRRAGKRPRRGIPFEPIPTTQPIVQVSPPSEPALRGLWEAIEPFPWQPR